MKKAISNVIIFTLIAKLLGFFRELLLSYYFGATGISDAYLISQTIPGVIFQFVGTGLATSFMPIFFKVLNSEGNEETFKFTNKILTMVFAFSTIVMVSVWMDTPVIIKAFASGFNGETLHYAIWFTRIGILSLYFSSMIYVFNSFLQANNVFGPTAFSAIPNSMFIMFSIYLGAKWNLWALTIGSTLAVGVQLLFLIRPVRKLGYGLEIDFRWKNKYIREFFCLMLPVVVGVCANEINILVDRTIASQIAEGGISALTYANSMIMLVQGGLVQPVSTVCYPKIAECVSKRDYRHASELLEKAITMLLSLLVPITVGCILYSRDITIFLFGRGVFNEQAVEMTAIAFTFYAIGICAVGLRELISKYFFACSNTKIPIKNGLIGVLINIGMNIFLSKTIGIGGLALATSISAFVTLILLVKDCKKILNENVNYFDIIQIAKIGTATIIMAFISYFTYLHIPFGLTAKLIIAVLVGLFVYTGMGYLLEIELVRSVVSVLKENTVNKIMRK